MIVWGDPEQRKTAHRTVFQIEWRRRGGVNPVLDGGFGTVKHRHGERPQGRINNLVRHALLISEPRAQALVPFH